MPQQFLSRIGSALPHLGGVDGIVSIPCNVEGPEKRRLDKATKYFFTEDNGDVLLL